MKIKILFTFLFFCNYFIISAQDSHKDVSKKMNKEQKSMEVSKASIAQEKSATEKSKIKEIPINKTITKYNALSGRQSLEEANKEWLKKNKGATKTKAKSTAKN